MNASTGNKTSPTTTLKKKRLKKNASASHSRLLTHSATQSIPTCSLSYSFTYSLIVLLYNSILHTHFLLYSLPHLLTFPSPYSLTHLFVPSPIYLLTRYLTVVLPHPSDAHSFINFLTQLIIIIFLNFFYILEHLSHSIKIYFPQEFPTLRPTHN